MQRSAHSAAQACQPATPADAVLALALWQAALVAARRLHARSWPRCYLCCAERMAWLLAFFSLTPLLLLASQSQLALPLLWSLAGSLEPSLS